MRLLNQTEISFVAGGSCFDRMLPIVASGAALVIAILVVKIIQFKKTRSAFKEFLEAEKSVYKKCKDSDFNKLFALELGYNLDDYEPTFKIESTDEE